MAVGGAGREPAERAAGGGVLSSQAARRAAWALYLIAFSSGGVLMGVEIAGSRILAPSFGTSIFVWGSLIGLFMGAMALGYYLGGGLADRRPSFPVLALIVSLASLYTFLVIPYAGPGICTEIALAVTHRALGPLLGSAVLFFVPSFLMAMVSPFAIKLNATSLAGLGGVAGKLYAISTAGSIVGTLLTTFVLIPLLHVTNVLQGLGVFLLLAALASLVVFQAALRGQTRSDRNAAAALALLALACVEVWVIWPVRPIVAPGQRLLRYEESSYHDIAVTEEVLFGGTEGRYLLQPDEVRRWLKFNENTESGVYPYRGLYRNAVEYTDVVHLCMLWAPQAKSLLVVGGGGGVIPTQFRLHYPTLETVDVLELDEAVERLAREYFRAGGHGVNYHIGDARMNLRRLDARYDIIILDAYSAGGQIPFHLLTWEFLKETKDHLAPNGVLVTNIITAVENDVPPTERPADLFFAEVKTLRASEAEARGLAHATPAQQAPLFRQLYSFPKVQLNGSLRGRETEYRNVIVLATDEERPRTRDEIYEQAKAFINSRDPDLRVDAQKFLWHAGNLYETGPKPRELERVPVLRDNYAPVETMYRPVKRDESTWRDF